MAIFPSQAFTKDNIKVRWKERYVSEAVNEKFLGMPRGVYAGFRPLVTPGSLVLTFGTEPGDGYSLVRVQSGDEIAMLDIITTTNVSMDFTGHGTWPVYVIASANYEVGTETSGTLFTRTTPASGPTEVNVCKVDRPGNTGDLIVSPNQVFPTNDITARQEPYAIDDTAGPPATTGQRFGFLPKGSVEKLGVAYLSAEEVVASRTDTNGVPVITFDDTNGTTQQNSGLPLRLKRDLSAAGMAARLGLQVKTVGCNLYSIPGLTVEIAVTTTSGFNVGDEVTATVGSPTPTGRVRAISNSPAVLTVHTLQGTFTTGTINRTGGGGTATITGVTSNLVNVSGSFSAKRRATPSINFPVVDASGGSTVPTGGPVAINPLGAEDPLPGSVGNHTPFEGAIAETSIILNLLTVTNVQNGLAQAAIIGTFLPGEMIIGSLSGARAVVHGLRFPTLVASQVSGTFQVNDVITGNVSGSTATVTAQTQTTFSDTTRNVCYINRSDTGERFTFAESNGDTSIIYGRLVFALQDLLPGSLTFTQGSTAVATTSDLRLTVEIGDIVLAPDGRYYEVTNVLSNQLTIHQSYLGTTAAAGNVLRRRINVRLRKRVSGAETDAKFDTTITAIPVQIYFPAWFSDENSNFDAVTTLYASGDPTVPDATTSVKGKVFLAPNNSGGPSNAVTIKAGTIANIQASGSSVPGVTGGYHTLNFVTSPGNITAGPPGVVNIAATGPAGPPGPPGPTGPGGTGSVGPPGPGFSSFGFELSAPISITTGGNTGNVTLTFSGITTVKMAAPFIGLNTPASGGAPAFWITNVTLSGNQVTVAWASNTTIAGLSLIIGCAAAG